MEITYDPAKNETNIRERGLSFEFVNELEWETVSLREVTRPEHGERRWRAWGLIQGRMVVLIYTIRAEGMRVISFRKANSRERKMYAQETAESLLD
jgi:uncharacterized DUF497 family protein